MTLLRSARTCISRTHDSMRKVLSHWTKWPSNILKQLRQRSTTTSLARYSFQEPRDITADLTQYMHPKTLVTKVMALNGMDHKAVFVITYMGTHSWHIAIPIEIGKALVQDNVLGRPQLASAIDESTTYKVMGFKPHIVVEESWASDKLRYDTVAHTGDPYGDDTGR